MITAEAMQTITQTNKERIAKELLIAAQRYAERQEAIKIHTIEWASTVLVQKMAERAEHGYNTLWLKLSRVNTDGNCCEMQKEKYKYADGRESYFRFGTGDWLNPVTLVEFLRTCGYRVDVDEHYYWSLGAGQQTGKELYIQW